MRANFGLCIDVADGCDAAAGPGVAWSGTLAVTALTPLRCAHGSEAFAFQLQFGQMFFLSRSISSWICLSVPLTRAYALPLGGSVKAWAG